MGQSNTWKVIPEGLDLNEMHKISKKSVKRSSELRIYHYDLEHKY